MIPDYHIQINIYGHSVEKIVQKEISLEHTLKCAGIFDFLILEVPQTTYQCYSSNKWCSTPHYDCNTPYYNHGREIKSQKFVEKFEEPDYNDYGYNDNLNWLCSTPIDLPDLNDEHLVTEEVFPPTTNFSELNEGPRTGGVFDDSFGKIDDILEAGELLGSVENSLFSGDSFLAGRSPEPSLKTLSLHEISDADEKTLESTQSVVEGDRSTLHYLADSESEFYNPNPNVHHSYHQEERDDGNEKSSGLNTSSRNVENVVKGSVNSLEKFSARNEEPAMEDMFLSQDDDSIETDLNTTFQSCFSFADQDNNRFSLEEESSNPVNPKKRKTMSESAPKFIVDCEHPDCDTQLFYEPKRGKANFTEHIRLHYDKLTRICEHCGVERRTIYGLRKHHNQVHPNRKFILKQENLEWKNDLREIAKICFPAMKMRV